MKRSTGSLKMTAQSNCGTPLEAQDLEQNEFFSAIFGSAKVTPSKIKSVLNSLVVKWPAKTFEHDASEASFLARDELFFVSEEKCLSLMLHDVLP